MTFFEANPFLVDAEEIAMPRAGKVIYARTFEFGETGFLGKVEARAVRHGKASYDSHCGATSTEHCGGRGMRGYFDCRVCKRHMYGMRSYPGAFIPSEVLAEIIAEEMAAAPRPASIATRYSMPT